MSDLGTVDLPHDDNPAPAIIGSIQVGQVAPTDPAAGIELGNIVTSSKARRIIYGVFGCAAIAAGGVAAYFLGIGHPIPVQVVGAQSVIAYLGIPVSGLALANAKKG